MSGNKGKRRKKRRTLVHHWLSGCGGCETALLNFGPDLMALYTEIEIFGLPLLEDRPIDPSSKFDYAIFTGAVATHDQMDLVKAVRRQSKVVIALGTCATHGGIPAMANKLGLDEIFRSLCPGPRKASRNGLPHLMDHLLALDELIEVDYIYPGCPPHPNWLRRLFKELLDRGPTPYMGKSVCDHCRFQRTGHFEEKVMRRLLPGNYPLTRGGDTPSGGRCLLEQGILCLGPVTIAGCGDKGEPLCLKANAPCRGCYGPVPGCHNQLLGLATILSTHKVDVKTLQDPGSLNRFIGGHGIYR